METPLKAYEPQVRERILTAHRMDRWRPTTSYIDVIEGCFATFAGAPTYGDRVHRLLYGRTPDGRAGSARRRSSAAVVFYGSAPKTEAIANIRCPVQGHYAVTDRGITGHVYDFALAMHAAGKSFNYSVYDADHGFGEPHARVHNPEAARLAELRSKAFLARCLLS